MDCANASVYDGGTALFESAMMAVRATRRRVLVVDEDRFARPGPRSVEAAEELEKWLHPADEREKQ